MKLPKEINTVTPFSRLMALILFITLPIIFFFVGIRYQSEIATTMINIPTPLVTKLITPTIPQLQPPAYGKVSIQGTVTSYNPIPAEIDGEPMLKVQIQNNTIFKVMLPSGESS